MRNVVSWWSLFLTARISFGLLFLVAAGLLLPPETRDMLAALSEPPHEAAGAAYCISFTVFACSCWYWSRAAISARFDLPDVKNVWSVASGAGGRPAINPAALHWAPQLAFAAAIALAFAVGWRSRAVLLTVGTIALLLIAWAAAWRRRSMGDWLRGRAGLPALATNIPPWDPRLRSTSDPRRWLGVTLRFRLGVLVRCAPFGPGVAKAGLFFSLALFVVLFIASTWGHETNWVRYLLWTMFTGPTPVFLGCAMIAGPLTAIGFAADGWRVPAFSRPPVVTLFVVVSLGMSALVTFHAIRVTGADRTRPDLATFWRDWQDSCGAGTRPIVVAISGGASRAGLWGASVLARLDEISAQRHGAAIFAISSVSGGSLGAASYMAARAANPSGCTLDPASQASFAAYAQTVGAADELGPLLAGFMFSDLPRSLLGWVPSLFGVDLRGGDRAAAIERSFETNARGAAAAAYPDTAKPRPLGFDESFLSLTRGKPVMPLWIANGTERDSGVRA